MPQNAKNTHRMEAPISKPVTQSRKPNGVRSAQQANGAQTEDERIAAMFQDSKNQWDAQQQEMAK